jgi:hypothetical protein
MYSGPERPASDVATVSGAIHRRIFVLYNHTREARILAVDDQQIIAPADEIVVLPGRHVVQVAYGTHHYIPLFFWWESRTRVRTIEFVADAGRRYRVDGGNVELMPDVQQYCAWVEDADTGTVVGGSKDPRVPPPTVQMPNAADIGSYGAANSGLASLTTTRADR